LDPRIRALLEESQSHIHTAALIHERLYQSNELAPIDLTHYLDSLCEVLLQSYRSPPHQASPRDGGAECRESTLVTRGFPIASTR
jgi:two-component sensor histidine kinase